MMNQPHPRYRLRKIGCAVAGLSAALLGPATAVRASDGEPYETITQKIVFEVSGHGVKMDAEFAPFDDEGGTRLLRNVTLERRRDWQARVSVENVSSRPIDQPRFYFLTGYKRMWLYGWGWSRANGGLALDGSLAPNDGQPGTGPDYHEFELQHSDPITGPWPLPMTDFTGPESVPIELSGYAYVNVNPDTDALHWQVHEASFTLTLTVTYHWEPASTCGSDIEDLIDLLAGFGACPLTGPCEGDLNNDHLVDTRDLLILLDAWTPCP